MSYKLKREYLNGLHQLFDSLWVSKCLPKGSRTPVYLSDYTGLTKHLKEGLGYRFVGDFIKSPNYLLLHVGNKNFSVKLKILISQVSSSDAMDCYFEDGILVCNANNEVYSRILTYLDSLKEYLVSEKRFEDYSTMEAHFVKILIERGYITAVFDFVNNGQFPNKPKIIRATL